MPPMALLLLSPWADPYDMAASCTAVPMGSCANVNMVSDYIGPPAGPITLYLCCAFLGPFAHESNGCFDLFFYHYVQGYVAPGCTDVWGRDAGGTDRSNEA